MNKFKTTTLVGILLIALGAIALVYQGITYTKRDKPIDLGPVQITTESKHTIPLPPVVGAIALTGGVVLLVIGSRKG